MHLRIVNANSIRHATSMAAFFILINATLAGWASPQGASSGGGAVAELSPAAFLLLVVVGITTFLFASKSLRDADLGGPSPTILALCVAALAVLGLRRELPGGEEGILGAILLNYSALGLTLLVMLLLLMIAPFFGKQLQNGHLRRLRKRAERKLRRQLNSLSNPRRKERR